MLINKWVDKEKKEVRKDLVKEEEEDHREIKEDLVENHVRNRIEEKEEDLRVNVGVLDLISIK